jgi:antitoxin PrlF
MHIYTTHAESANMKVTRKGQVTIPAEIRKALGIKEGDKVAFVVEDNQVKLTRKGSVVTQTAGMLKSSQPALTPQEEHEAAEQAIADEAIRRMRG